MTEALTVSIVIATHNRASQLAITLDGLIRQRWPRERFEIVVADNASTDRTCAVVDAAAARADAPAIRYLYVATPGKSHAVNAAFGEARGDVFLLTDDDVRPGERWVERLTAALDETGAHFAAGRVLPAWEAPPPPWVSSALHGVLAIPDNGTERLIIDSVASRVVPIGANMAVRADVVARVGGLRTDLGKLAGTLRTGEDHEFFLRLLRAGCRGVYEPEAVVRHWVPKARLTRAYSRRWLYQNGRDVARLEATTPQPVPHLCAVPRYRWREALAHVWSGARAAVAGDAAGRFAAQVRLLWLCGYVREAWFGDEAGQTPAVADPAVRARTRGWAAR